MTEASPTLKLSPPSFWNLAANPIFRRYAKSRLRSRAVGVALILTLVISGFLYLFMPTMAQRADEFAIKRFEQIQKKNPRLIERWGLTKPKPATVRPERTPFYPLLLIQGIILFVLGTGQVAGGMTAEGDEGSVDYQRLTPMTPLTKVLGYLLGLPVREYVMFLSTVPLTALTIWRGEIPFSAWGPVYLAFFSSVVVYHFTGLVAGTVVKNRRWAFLLAMALVFMLYVLMPMGAGLGLQFLRFLTLWPVLADHADLIVQGDALQNIRIMGGVTAGADARVPFFNLEFGHLSFTLLVQGSFALALLAMVWRKWRHAESHLLSKLGCLATFVWINLLIVGNALPSLQSRTLFFTGLVKIDQKSRDMADPFLGLLLSVVFGTVLLLVLLLLAILMTPRQDDQTRALRRARKLGQRRIPWLADESTAFPWLCLFCVAGAAVWNYFSNALTQSRDLGEFSMTWHPGIWPFLFVLLPVSLAFQSLLESRGGKWPFLAFIFLGVVPLMAGLIVLAAARGKFEDAVWISSASPLFLIVLTVLQKVDFQPPNADWELFRATATRAWWFWTSVYALAAVPTVFWLRKFWRRQKERVFGSAEAQNAPISAKEAVRD
jgi:hypothetical protein